MVIVTDHKYFLETRLVPKLDLMIKRCEQPHPKKDIVLIIEGAEGEGKTNTSAAIANYIKYKTGREAHLFFTLEPLIKFAQSTEKKIIIWDEPALDGLSTDWYKKANKDLLRLLMTCRKKRHFFLFNFTKFFKFSEYIVVDRAIALIHMYSLHEMYPGRFLYIPKRNLERLFLSYRASKKRMYKKFGTIRGSFPEVLEKHFDTMGFFVEGKPNATNKDYEAAKDRGIVSIGKDTEVRKSAVANDERVIALKQKLSKLKFPIRTQIEFCNQFGITDHTLRDWGKKGYFRRTSKSEPEKGSNITTKVERQGGMPEEGDDE